MRIYITLLLMVSTLSIQCQEQDKRWTLTPYAGIFVGILDATETPLHFSGEADYRISNSFSLSGTAEYNYQSTSESLFSENGSFRLFDIMVGPRIYFTKSERKNQLYLGLYAGYGIGTEKIIKTGPTIKKSVNAPVYNLNLGYKTKNNFAFSIMAEGVAEFLFLIGKVGYSF